jgi:sugar-specific transcriptional regulator TrmB
VLVQLEEMGFVAKGLSAPITFKPLPLKETITILMEARAKKSRELQTKTQRLLQKFNAREKTGVAIEEPQFFLIPRGRAYLQQGKEAIKAATNDIDCITSYKRFVQMMNVAGKDIAEALERGVKFRFIMDKPAEKVSPKILDNFHETFFWNVKYVSSSPQAIIGLYDGKKVHIAITTDGYYGDFSKSQMLTSKNPSFVSIIKEFFETMWRKKS